MWDNTEICLATSYIQKGVGLRSIWQFVFVLPVEKTNISVGIYLLKLFSAKGVDQERTELRKRIRFSLEIDKTEVVERLCC